MRIILHCVLILAFAFLLKNVYYLSSLLKPSPEVKFYLVQEEVRFYRLAVQWPPGVCSEEGVRCGITPVPTEFTIHGLWPDPNGTTPDVPFNKRKLDPIITELKTNWPNLKRRNNSFFWELEWDRHGRFSEMEELKYFNKTLELFKDDGERLREKLAGENITPSNTYKLKVIEAKLKKINGRFSCTVKCNERKQSKKNEIQEIRFKYTNKFKKVNNSPSLSCGGGDANTDVLFPLMP